MCAINGFNWRDKELVLKMNAATVHRGPDGTRASVESNVSLGHNRLAVIDVGERAAQPMESADGRHTIIFNGEIYNYRELRSKLSAYPFRTESDTEVILAAHRKWGLSCVERLNGMFAFAIWDREGRKLLLARDPAGIKPLYYFFDGSRFIFSSEIKGILVHPDVPRRIQPEAFEHYLRVQYVPEPLTLFADIQKMPPSHTATLCGAKLSLKPYTTQVHCTDVSISPDELRTVIYKAVERQLVSDKPLGVYLSGGIDSSAILAGMAASGHKHVDTFSIGFELGRHEEPEKFNADFRLARKTAKYFGTKHHEVSVTSDDTLEHFEKAVAQLDEPIGNPTAIVQFLLAAFAKRAGVDVVLSGDGGDELFGGYERYRLSRAATLYQAVVPKVVREAIVFDERLTKLNTPAGVDRFALFMFQKDEVLRSIAPHPVSTVTEQHFSNHYFSHLAHLLPEEQLMEVDRRSWLVDEALMRADKMSMASGLENRVPLLDLELAHYARSLPLADKVSPFATKILLKKALRRHIPDELFRQPKRGWFSPAAKWLRHEKFRRFAKDVLSPAYCSETRPLFNWDEVSRMLEDHVAGRRYNLTLIWALLTFQAWARMYKVSL